MNINDVFICHDNCFNNNEENLIKNTKYSIIGRSYPNMKEDQLVMSCTEHRRHENMFSKHLASKVSQKHGSTPIFWNVT